MFVKVLVMMTGKLLTNKLDNNMRDGSNTAHPSIYFAMYEVANGEVPLVDVLLHGKNDDSL